MTLQNAIATCCERAVNSGEEFDAEDVLACLYANYPEEISESPGGHFGKIAIERGTVRQRPQRARRQSFGGKENNVSFGSETGLYCNESAVRCHPTSLSGRISVRTRYGALLPSRRAREVGRVLEMRTTGQDSGAVRAADDDLDIPGLGGRHRALECARPSR